MVWDYSGTNNLATAAEKGYEWTTMTPAENSPDDAPSGDESKGDALRGRFQVSPEPVEYSGSVAGHEVLVEIRHSVVDTTLARMWVDGTPALQKSEDDAARKKARKRLAALDKKEAKEGELSEHDCAARRLDEDSADHPWHAVFDAKYFSFDTTDADADEGDEENDEKDRDKDGKTLRIKVKLRSLGKTAEVTTAMTAKPQFLVPAAGSDSARRDAKQLANPQKFALRSAAIKAIAIVLGIGAAWVGGRIISWLVRQLSPLMPEISLPSINIPTPDISVPSISLPSIDLPALPSWLGAVEPFIQPVVLILIAGVVAWSFAKRKQKALQEREDDKDAAPGE